MMIALGLAIRTWGLPDSVWGVWVVGVFALVLMGLLILGADLVHFRVSVSMTDESASFSILSEEEDDDGEVKA